MMNRPLFTVCSALVLAALAGCTAKERQTSGNGGGGAGGGGAAGGEGGAATTSSSSSSSSTSGAATTSSSSSSSGTPTDDPAQLCVDGINAYRATLGLPALARWTDQEVCAADQAQKDAAVFTPHSAFTQCGEVAQNECPNWQGPPKDMIAPCLAMMWAEGPGTDFSTHGHYINMSNPGYTKVACGFYVLDNGKVWGTQDFH